MNRWSPPRIELNATIEVDESQDDEPVGVVVDKHFVSDDEE